ncbi:MAG: hypothetical protein ACYC63_08320 [Armatimonadota bacterium]
MRRMASVVVVLLLLMVLACTGCGGQTEEKVPPTPGPGALPAGPDQDAPKAPAQPTTPPVGARDEAGQLMPTPWRDVVHFFGVAAGLLALAAVLAGAVIFFVHNLPGHPYQSPARRRTRWIHIGTGLTAILCGTVHFIGRLIQLDHFELETSPPFLAWYFFALILISGILRNWTPKALRKQWWIFAWLHRLGVVGALYYLTRHTLYQAQKFLGGDRS